MDQAIRLESPSEPAPGAPAIRPLATPTPRETSAAPRWELVEQEPPSRWASPPPPPPVPAAAVSAATPSSRSSSLSWELVEPAAAPTAASPPAQAEPKATAKEQLIAVAGPTWEAILPGEEITAEDVAQAVKADEEVRQEATANLAPPPVEATYGGFRDLYRGNRWYPSISTIVPMGFGPTGFMAGIGFSGAECRPESGTCTRSSKGSAESAREESEAVLDGYLGFGDSSKTVGVLITQTSGSSARSAVRGSFFERMQTGFAVSRNFGPNTALKLGAEGALVWDRDQYFSQFNSAEVPKSAFAVASHRIPLVPVGADATAPPLRRWFSDLYLTVGLGNGVFRPSDDVIQAQIREIKRAGCWNSPCPPERVKKARIRGSEWGDPSLIAALALAVTDQVNLITEWTGRNLNVSMSIQPFRRIGLTITPGIGNLVRNSDYNNGYPKEAVGCDNCDFGNLVTNRPIFYLRSMISVKF